MVRVLGRGFVMLVGLFLILWLVIAIQNVVTQPRPQVLTMSGQTNEQGTAVPVPGADTAANNTDPEATSTPNGGPDVPVHLPSPPVGGNQQLGQQGGAQGNHPQPGQGQQGGNTGNGGRDDYMSEIPDEHPQDLPQEREIRQVGIGGDNSVDPPIEADTLRIFEYPPQERIGSRTVQRIYEVRADSDPDLVIQITSRYDQTYGEYTHCTFRYLDNGELIGDEITFPMSCEDCFNMYDWQDQINANQNGFGLLDQDLQVYFEEMYEFFQDWYNNQNFSSPAP